MKRASAVRSGRASQTGRPAETKVRSGGLEAVNGQCRGTWYANEAATGLVIRMYAQRGEHKTAYPCKQHWHVR